MKFIVLATIYASIAAAAFLIAAREEANDSAGLYRDGTRASLFSDTANDDYDLCQHKASLLNASGQGGNSRCR
jgi:hypothetical protein